MSDPKPESEVKPEAVPKDDKPSGEGKKGQFSARGGRGGGGRNQGVKYVKKGENAGPEEETKGEADPKEHKEKKAWKGDRKPKEERTKEKEKITLETVIPEKPKKHDILKEPNEDEFHKQIDEIEDKIEAVYERRVAGRAFWAVNNFFYRGSMTRK